MTAVEIGFHLRQIQLNQTKLCFHDRSRIAGRVHTDCGKGDQPSQESNVATQIMYQPHGEHNSVNATVF